jgi:hypothetical protein
VCCYVLLILLVTHLAATDRTQLLRLCVYVCVCVSLSLIACVPLTRSDGVKTHVLKRARKSFVFFSHVHIERCAAYRLISRVVCSSALVQRCGRKFSESNVNMYFRYTYTEIICGASGSRCKEYCYSTRSTSPWTIHQKSSKIPMIPAQITK